MEIQKQEHLFKKIAQYGGLTLFGVIVVFAVAFSMNPDIAKYFLGSLLNGVTINTPTTSNHYAYGENIGWIDFNPTGGNVKVGDNGLTGYAYGENVGWIALGDGDATHPPYANNSPTNWGVNNDGSGNLSGYAYGENVGWIDFNPTGGGVKINTTTGAFSGYAYGENIGWISFSGTGYGVVTDWRANILVSSITVTGAGSATTVINGHTLQMSASVSPDNATNSAITWSKTNGSGSATINSSGLLTATGVGTVTVKATATDGSGIYGELIITVTTSNISVTGVSLNEHTAALTVGDTDQLTDTVSPTNATNTSVSWNSSNTAVATVNSSGLVTAVSAGSATITVTTTDGGFTDTDAITVTGAVGDSCTSDSDCNSQWCSTLDKCTDGSLNSSCGTSDDCDGSQCISGTCGGIPHYTDGICGSSNGQSFTTTPDTNLCSQGNATTVSGSGPWTWSCNSPNGGTNASCSAQLTVVNTPTPVVSGGGGNALVTNQSAINYISQILNLLKQSMANLFTVQPKITPAQPTTTPPANLRPTTSPTATPPTTTTQNQTAIIQAYQKLLVALKSLLNFFSKKNPKQ